MDEYSTILDSKITNLLRFQLCCIACAKDSCCIGYTYNNSLKRCFMKSTLSYSEVNHHAISGLKANINSGELFLKYFTFSQIQLIFIISFYFTSVIVSNYLFKQENIRTIHLIIKNNNEKKFFLAKILKNETTETNNS